MVVNEDFKLQDTKIIYEIFSKTPKQLVPMEGKKFIDVENVIKNKNPRLLKVLPRFVLNYIKKILHEDEFNQLMIDLKDYKSMDFVHKLLERYSIRIDSKGTENIEKNKRYIFAANHTIGGFDALVFMNEVDKYAGSLRFIVNDILLSFTNYEPLFVGVNKHGSTPRENIKRIDEIYESEHQVLIFPAGLVSRRINGVVRDLRWYKSFIAKSIQCKRDVIPVRISGEMGGFFYNLANFRKALGIKANIEMFYLADEAFKHRNTEIKIRFGESIPYTHFDKSKSIEQWAEWVQNKVYEMDL